MRLDVDPIDLKPGDVVVGVTRPYWDADPVITVDRGPLPGITLPSPVQNVWCDYHDKEHYPGEFDEPQCVLNQF